jgi:hypothetical protein
VLLIVLSVAAPLTLHETEEFPFGRLGESLQNNRITLTASLQTKASKIFLYNALTSQKTFAAETTASANDANVATHLVATSIANSK